MTTHWPQWYWTPGLADGKGLWWGEVAFSRCSLINLSRRAQDKDAEGDPDRTDIKNRYQRQTSKTYIKDRHQGQTSRTDIKDRLDETRGRHPATLTPSGDASSHELAQMALRDSSLDGSTGREIECIQLNYIIHF